MRMTYSCRHASHISLKPFRASLYHFNGGNDLRRAAIGLDSSSRHLCRKSKFSKV